MNFIKINRLALICALATGMWLGNVDAAGKKAPKAFDYAAEFKAVKSPEMGGVFIPRFLESDSTKWSQTRVNEVTQMIEKYAKRFGQRANEFRAMLKQKWDLQKKQWEIARALGEEQEKSEQLETGLAQQQQEGAQLTEKLGETEKRLGMLKELSGKRVESLETGLAKKTKEAQDLEAKLKQANLAFQQADEGWSRTEQQLDQQKKAFDQTTTDMEQKLTQEKNNYDDYVKTARALQAASAIEKATLQQELAQKVQRIAKNEQDLDTLAQQDQQVIADQAAKLQQHEQILQTLSQQVQAQFEQLRGAKLDEDERKRLTKENELLQKKYQQFVAKMRKKMAAFQDQLKKLEAKEDQDFSARSPMLQRLADTSLMDNAAKNHQDRKAAFGNIAARFLQKRPVPSGGAVSVGAELNVATTPALSSAGTAAQSGAGGAMTGPKHSESSTATGAGEIGAGEIAGIPVEEQRGALWDTD